ncbi:SMP-30/gluconolactonase/LRE family protein [Bacillus alkalicellulosilyticus]|uniref:SMP-30/gluconolactonase/LRE family protein n=1 Tax=Alkalihalobacterium alkalicellulosilyticum TaxID=1912214 RepID=UPI000997571C|nr:SMP-30/gluconolactonase/LRE family protein [Bacillus alkalicellulosilyticus]
MSEVELIIDAKAQLGEGPSWDEKNSVLYWVDIISKKVNVYEPVSKTNKEVQLDEQVGAIVPREVGGAVVALETGFYTLDLKTGKSELIGDPEQSLLNNRFNDGKCDPVGRFWAGTMDQNARTGKGAFYCLDNDHRITKKLENVTISNGLAWSLDHAHLYYIDTPTKKIVRFEFNKDTAEIQNPIDIIHFSGDEGMPDGMTIDAEGMLWIAHWGGAKISRWNPNTGEQLNSISIPALNVTSCVFAGPDLMDLYVTTARVGMTESELEKFPNSGGVFKVNPGVKGTPTYSFKG